MNRRGFLVSLVAVFVPSLRQPDVVTDMGVYRIAYHGPVIKYPPTGRTFRTAHMISINLDAWTRHEAGGEKGWKV